MEWLRQEALDFSRPRHGQPVVFGQFVHPENRDDVLQIFVALENHLHASRDFIVLRAHNVRIQNTRSGVQRVDGRIDAQLCDLARKNRGRVEMGERRRRRGIGQVVGRNVDRLNRGDGTLTR